MIYSAHDICTTRLCQAANCEADALTGWGLCERHDQQQKRRRHQVTLHATPPRLPPTLQCSTCNEWKPDNEFPHLTPEQATAKGRKPSRRGRYCNCNECSEQAAIKTATRKQIRAFNHARKTQATYTKTKPVRP